MATLLQYVINPTYNATQIQFLDETCSKTSLDLTYKRYLPGYIGLNNVKANDYCNVIFQSLGHVRPLRDYFLSTSCSEMKHSSELVKRFGLLIRKMWNSHAFKGQVSPHELLQVCPTLDYVSPASFACFR
jgi:U4/U6.U5 tri-snRNP-associated protein 2